MHLVLGFQQQDFAALNTLNLDFLLLTILQLQGRDVLELELLRHSSDRCTECSSLNIRCNKLRFAPKL